MQYSFSEDFLKVLEFSRDEALRTGWHNICPDHIMLAALRHGENSACSVLEALGVSTAGFKESIDEAIFVSEQIPWEERDSINLCESARSFLGHAALEALRCKSEEVEPLHFLLACCRISGPYCSDYLAEHEVGVKDIVEAAGMDWNSYGLSQPAAAKKEAAAPDPEALAAALEKRIREGYTLDNPIVS